MQDLVAVLMSSAMLMTIALIIFTALRCQSTKKTYFIFLAISACVYIFGSMLEILSDSPESALAAVKVVYLGGVFLAPLVLLFTADYLDVRLSRNFKRMLGVIPAVVIVLMWTTEFTSLFYLNYVFMYDSVLQYLEVTPAPLYYLLPLFNVFCIAYATFLLIRAYRTFDKRYKQRLILLAAAIYVPFLSDLTYLLGLKFYGISSMCFAIALFDLIFFINIIYYDLFDIMPRISSMVMNLIPEGLIVLDDELDYIDANPVAFDIFDGLSGLGKNDCILKLETWPPALSRLKQTPNAEIRFITQKNRTERHYIAKITAVYDKSGIVVMWYMILISDVTDMVMLMRRLQDEAHTDELMGIYNRRYFKEITAGAVAKSRRAGKMCYVVMIDIDKFRLVNDKYGFSIGDIVLQGAANCIRGQIRQYDILARYGGEQFVLLIVEIPQTQALELVNRIKNALVREEFLVYGNNIKIKASYGVAAFEQGFTLDDALGRADDALRTAKETGGDKVVVSSFTAP